MKKFLKYIITGICIALIITAVTMKIRCDNLRVEIAAMRTEIDRLTALQAEMRSQIDCSSATDDWIYTPPHGFPGDKIPPENIEIIFERGAK